MVGSDTSSDAAFGSQYHRDLCFAAEHIAVVGADVHELVHCYGNKIDVHNFSHRPHAPKGRTDRSTCDGRLRYCGINDSVGAEFGQQPSRCLIRAAVKADILAHHDNVLVSFKLFSLSGGDRLADGHNIHPELRVNLTLRLLSGLFFCFRCG